MEEQQRPLRGGEAASRARDGGREQPVQEQAIVALLEKARQADLEKSAFLSRMSHELRTPINGILGMLTIMERCSGDPERQRDCREKIRVSAEHLLSLVNDALRSGRSGEEGAGPVEEPFDLRHLLEDCAAILAPQAEEAGVRVTLETAGLRRTGTAGDPLRLRQILLDLMGRAADRASPGGSVSVRVRELARVGDTAEYQFTVEASGGGGRETGDGAAGADLSAAGELAAGLGGCVQADGGPAGEAVFRALLPLKVTAGQGAEPADREAEPQDGISGMRVLLADDNAINCEIMKFILERSGAEVVTVRDGQAAVDAFAASDPGAFDCVLMDLMMPVMDGYAATRTIRGLDRPDGETVPIVALSANGFPEDVARALAAGMDEHLEKPVDIDRLFRTMRRGRTGKART